MNKIALLLIVFIMTIQIANTISYMRTLTPVQPNSLWLPLSSCTMYFSPPAPTQQIILYNCSQSDQTISIWKQCFQTCCGPAEYYKFTTPSSEALLYCVEVNDQNANTNIVIIVMITILVISMVSCIICLYCMWRKRSQARTRPVLVNPKQIEWSQEEQINYQNHENISWSGLAHRDKPLKYTEQICTICLEDNMNSQLFCEHQYHHKCIGQWLSKSTVCPYCRRQRIKGIKVYCSKCKWRYFVITSSLISKRFSNLKTVCEGCAAVTRQKVQNSEASLVFEEDNDRQQVRKYKEAHIFNDY